MADNSSSLHSPLWRHVSRHAQTSAIFRAIAPPPPASSTPPVRAFMQAAPTALPIGHIAAADEVMATTAPESGNVPSLQRAINAAEAMTGSGQTIAPAQVVQRQAMQQVEPAIAPAVREMGETQTAVSETTPSSEPAAIAQRAVDTGAKESNWGRLKQIVRGHEHKQMPSGRTQTPPAVQRQVAPEATTQQAIAAAEAMTPSPAAKRTPLEAAWPVQRTTDTSASTPTHHTPAVPSAPVVSTQPPPKSKEIQAKLGNITAGRPTDSSIELHLPRRPRPDVAQAKRDGGDGNGAFWDRVRGTAGKPSYDVQTDVGPLPSDMWEMLGETPPGGSGEPASGEMASVQRAISAAESTDDVPSFLMPKTAVSPVKPDSIQRTADIEQENDPQMTQISAD